MSTAVGAGATAATANSVALGANSVANSTTLGTAGFAPVGGTAISAATAAGEVSIGQAGAERRITNVAAGLNPTDAVNLSQLMSVDAKVNNITNGGAGIKYFHTNSAAPDSMASGNGSVAVGPAASASNGNTIAIGSGATASGGSSQAFGLNAQSSGSLSTAIGPGANAMGLYATALGYNTSAVQQNTFAMGSKSTASASDAIAIGTQSISDANSDAAISVGRLSRSLNAPNALAIGNQAMAAAANVVALGFNATATASNSVALGANSTTTANLTSTGYNPGSGSLSGTASTANGEVSVGSTGTERRLTNVAAGSAATDAVNVSQLQSENAKVNAQGAATAAALGGGSTYNSTTGAITNPTYVVGGSTINNVAGAISNIDARTTQNANDITNIDARTTQNSSDITDLTTAINNGELGLVQQDATTRNISVAKTTDGTIVDFTGTAGARKLTGVHAGDVSASSADAINGSQLYSLANSTASAIGGGSTVNSDGSISAPSYVIGGTTMNSIAGAITNIDARTTQNASDISSINTALSDITGGGMGIKYFHTNSMLADSQATGSESVAIGGAAVATAANSVALGSNSVANRANSVSVGSAGAERQITNVAAGTADTDAVNVAQLKATGLVGTDGTSKAAVTYDSNADGSVSYSSVTMGSGIAGGTTIHNVAAGTVDTDAVNVAQMNSALANVTNIAMNSSAGNPMFAASGDRSAEAASANGQHATAMGANAKASADNSVALGANSVADRANTVSVGSKGNERQIANVAAGTQGTDAVNVDQMNDAVASATGNLPAGMSAKDYTDQRFNSMQNTVNQVAKNSYAGVAAAMAMPNMTPSQPGNTVVAAGAGSYKSGAALGVGATYRSRNSKWLVNGAVSVTSTGDAGVRAQVGYEF
jgi:autotransporter adhesin